LIASKWLFSIAFTKALCGFFPDKQNRRVWDYLDRRANRAGNKKITLVNFTRVKTTRRMR